MKFNALSKRFNIAIVALAISVVTLSYNVYSGYRSRTIAELSSLQNKADKLQKELEEPLAYVEFKYASDFLNEDMLKRLPIIPSSVEISHVKGATAKNITLDVSSTVPIKNIIKINSVDNYRISYSDKTLKRIRIDIPELRRDSKISIGLCTSEIPAFKFKFFADNGGVFIFEEEEKARREFIDSYKADVERADLDPMDNTAAKLKAKAEYIISVGFTTKELQLQLLESQISILKNDNPLKASFRYILASPVRMIIVCVLLMLSTFGWSLSLGWRINKRILSTVENGDVGVGDSLPKILEQFGMPLNFRSYDRNLDGFDFGLGYISGGNKGPRLAFKFIGATLVEIEDHVTGKITKLCSTNENKDA